MFTSETLKAGLKVTLFFSIGFVLLGEPLPLSLCLGALGGVAGCFLFAGWKHTELPALPTQIAESNRAEEIILAREGKKQREPKQRHQPSSSLFFWKNSRPPKHRR